LKELFKQKKIQKLGNKNFSQHIVTIFICFLSTKKFKMKMIMLFITLNYNNQVQDFFILLMKRIETIKLRNFQDNYLIQ